MGKIRKIIAFLKRKKPSPAYTRRQWIMKAATLFICAVGMDLSGLKLNELDVGYYFHRLSYEQAYGLNFAYYAGLHGLFWGLALWKLFEMYWWGREKVQEIRENPQNSIEILTTP